MRRFVWIAKSPGLVQMSRRTAVWSAVGVSRPGGSPPPVERIGALRLTSVRVSSSPRGLVRNLSFLAASAPPNAPGTESAAAAEPATPKKKKSRRRKKSADAAAPVPDASHESASEHKPGKPAFLKQENGPAQPAAETADPVEPKPASSSSKRRQKKKDRPPPKPTAAESDTATPAPEQNPAPPQSKRERERGHSPPKPPAAESAPTPESKPTSPPSPPSPSKRRRRRGRHTQKQPAAAGEAAVSPTVTPSDVVVGETDLLDALFSHEWITIRHMTELLLAMRRSLHHRGKSTGTSDPQQQLVGANGVRWRTLAKIFNAHMTELEPLMSRVLATVSPAALREAVRARWRLRRQAAERLIAASLPPSGFSEFMDRFRKYRSQAEDVSSPVHALVAFTRACEKKLQMRADVVELLADFAEYIEVEDLLEARKEVVNRDRAPFLHELIDTLDVRRYATLFYLVQKFQRNQQRQSSDGEVLDPSEEASLSRPGGGSRSALVIGRHLRELLSPGEGEQADPLMLARLREHFVDLTEARLLGAWQRKFASDPLQSRSLAELLSPSSASPKDDARTARTARTGGSGDSLLQGGDPWHPNNNEVPRKASGGRTAQAASSSSSEVTASSAPTLPRSSSETAASVAAEAAASSANASPNPSVDSAETGAASRPAAAAAAGVPDEASARDPKDDEPDVRALERVAEEALDRADATLREELHVVTRSLVQCLEHNEFTALFVRFCTWFTGTRSAKATRDVLDLAQEVCATSCPAGTANQLERCLQFLTPTYLRNLRLWDVDKGAHHYMAAFMKSDVLLRLHDSWGQADELVDDTDEPPPQVDVDLLGNEMPPPDGLDASASAESAAGEAAAAADNVPSPGELAKFDKFGDFMYYASPIHSQSLAERFQDRYGSTKLAINNLPVHVSVSHVIEVLSRCGRVVGVEIFKDKLRSKELQRLDHERAVPRPRMRKLYQVETYSPVYAFVYMAEDDGYRNATAPALQLFGVVVQGRLCRTSPVSDKRELFVGNLPKDISVDEVRFFLSEMVFNKLPGNGHIVSLHRDSPATLRKGYVLVTFDTHAAAQAAYWILLRQHIHRRRLRVGWAEVRRRVFSSRGTANTSSSSAATATASSSSSADSRAHTFLDEAAVALGAAFDGAIK